jgi:hypothetical protein
MNDFLNPLVIEETKRLLCQVIYVVDLHSLLWSYMWSPVGPFVEKSHLDFAKEWHFWLCNPEMALEVRNGCHSLELNGPDKTHSLIPSAFEIDGLSKNRFGHLRIERNETSSTLLCFASGFEYGSTLVSVPRFVQFLCHEWRLQIWTFANK